MDLLVGDSAQYSIKFVWWWEQAKYGPFPRPRFNRRCGEELMAVERSLTDIGLRAVRRLKDATAGIALGKADDLHGRAAAQRGAVGKFEHDSELAEKQSALQPGDQGVDADGRTPSGRALSDFTREAAMRSRLRDMERKRWKLAQQLEQRPNAWEGLRTERLDRAELEHRRLNAEVEDIVEARRAWGAQPWEVANSPQRIRELRDSENRRQQARDRVEALKLRREELRAELGKLRGDVTPEDRSGAARAGDQQSRVTAESRLQDLEIRYDDRTAAGLRDLKGAQQNVEWMVGELAKQQSGLERDIGRLEGELTKEQERLAERRSQQPQQVLIAAQGMKIPDRPERPGQKSEGQERQDKEQKQQDKEQKQQGKEQDKEQKQQDKEQDKEQKQQDKEQDKEQKQRDKEQSKEQKQRDKEQSKEQKQRDKEQSKEQKQRDKEQKERDKGQESQEKKDKRAANLRSVGLAGVGIAAGAAAAVGFSAAIDAGSGDSAGDADSDGAGDQVSGDSAGDVGSVGAGDVGSVGAAAGPGYVGGGAAVPTGVEPGSALGSDPVSASGIGFDGDSSSGLSEENARAQNNLPSPGSFGTDPAALGTPLSGGQGFDAASLLLPLMLSNLSDPGPADPGPDEGSENDSDRYHDSDPSRGAQPITLPPPAQQAVTTPWSRQASADETSVADPGRQAGETAPRSVLPSSPAGPPDDRRSVVYTHTGDGVTETVSASVAAAYERAYGNKSATDAKAAYTGTDAEWADEKILEPVDPNDLMSGDVITFDNGSAMMRVQNEEGHPDGGKVDVIIKGELTPIEAVMAEGAGELGRFAGFGHPPGIEPPASEGRDAGAAVPTTGDQSGDTTVPV
ncbi:hypothetical protein GCM10011588_26280 [Nocardia jinanensis]|uniref:Uncharacterized protein n=1 Tax=Nocardia jinanensis TaxID=382504 RepID=A0A917RIZ1_9NOCA|nr:hypothetical protein GCM10011588_26280 [Nocardia jinanensis]